MSDCVLKLLDPVTDTALYREAYSWREKAKPHTQPDRMPFEEFAAVSDTQLTVGLFNGELQAVYHLIEVEPSIYEAHFTTRRGVTRETSLLGARETARLLLENGASRINAWVTERNRPLRSFLESLGFTVAGVSQFPCQEPESVSKCPRRNSRTFVRYTLEGKPPSG